MLRNALRKENATRLKRPVASSACPLDYLMWNNIFIYVCVGFCCKIMEYSTICKKKLPQILRNALRTNATPACH